MKYIQRGNGDYLILVHGALTDSSMWLSHINNLEADFDVIAVTLRHFDEDDSGGFGLNTHAEDLTDLLTELARHKPVNIVGWSYGADVVLNALAKQDLPAEKVFLYEPGYPGCLQESELNSWQLDANAMFGQVFEHFSNGNIERAVESLMDASGKSQGYFQSQSKAAKELQLSKGYTLAYQLNQQENPAIDSATISGIRIPIVLGYGQNTRDLFRLVTITTSDLLKKSELSEVSGENHMLPLENPEKFSNYIKSIFLPKS